MELHVLILKMKCVVLPIIVQKMEFGVTGVHGPYAQGLVEVESKVAADLAKDKNMVGRHVKETRTSKRLATQTCVNVI